MGLSSQRMFARTILLCAVATAACSSAAAPTPAGSEGADPSSEGQPDDEDSGAEALLDGGKKSTAGDARAAGSRPGDAALPTGSTGHDAAVGRDAGPADAAEVDAGVAPSDTNDAGPALWIAPSGSDQAPGTQEQPLQTLTAAHERATPGTTIWVGPGTYALSETVKLTRKGQEGKPIAIFAAEGPRPVFDFAGQPRGQSAARGIAISGDYWHLRGIDVINAGDNCINISGAYNTIEHVVIHGCSDTGLQITANSSEASDATRAAHNTIVNTDSYENYDGQNQGENADGFAAKLYIGPGNVFRGCRAWNNSDDGWDLFASNDVVVIEDCWAVSNGKIGPSQSNTNGDGNGFKLGGAAAAGDANQGGAVHAVKGCVSISNRACGFVRNNNTSVPQLTSCGGEGDGKGTYCSLTSSGSASVTMSAAQAIAAARDADGNLPPMK
jgi:hypothetical protein